MTIIVYNSKTGSCKKYAEILSQRTGLECYSIKDTYPKDEDIVFIGWLMKFTVKGLSKVDRSKLRAVCVVGCDEPEFFPKGPVIENNGYDAETFYLRGWIIPEKLGFKDRFVLRVVSKILAKKAEGHVSKDLLTAMVKGGDFFDESYIDQVEAFVKGQ